MVQRKSDAELKGEALRALENCGFVTIPQAALILDLHPATLRSHIAKGKIESIHIHPWPRIMRDELTRYQQVLAQEEQRRRQSNSMAAWDLIGAPKSLDRLPEPSYRSIYAERS